MNISVEHYNDAVDALVFAKQANNELDLYWETKERKHLYEHTRLKQQFNKIFKRFTDTNKELVPQPSKAQAA